jgi:acyl carrier protein
MATTVQIESAISDFMERELGQCPAPSQALLGAGYLDSLRFVLFVAYLEERFGIAIPPDDMTETNFGNIGMVTEYLARRTG